MTFVSPLFLWALTAIAVPIVIHLFNFRKYQKVYFTNVRFLKELQIESKSKSRLKEILVLVLRCLAIFCLVLAFSQPFIPAESSATNTSAQKMVSIYIDNSFSMQSVNKQGPIFEVAKQLAKELVNSSSNMTKFQIVTNDFEGKHQRFLYKEDALNALDELKISSAVRSISEVLLRQKDFLNDSKLISKKIYLFTDAQQSTFNLIESSPDSAIYTTIISLKANLERNVYVDTLWFESPLQQKGFIQKLHAKIVNSGNKEITTSSAKLFLNNRQVGISTFSISPNAHSEVIFSFESKESGFNFGSVKIEDYPVSFDDELFFAFNSHKDISVCLINGKESAQANALTALFNHDSLFKLTSLSEQRIDYNFFKTADVLILNQLSDLSSGLTSELLKYTKRGGSLVIIPPVKAPYDTYNQGMNALNLPTLLALDTAVLKTDKIEIASDFYRAVFEKLDERLNMPRVNKHYTYTKNKFTNHESLLFLQNGETFFGRSRSTNSYIYLFSSPLEESCSNFSKHALFVPTFYQIAFSGLISTPLFYPVSTNQSIQLKADALLNNEPPHILKSDKTSDVIPEIRNTESNTALYTQLQITLPGFYELMQGDVSLLPLAFNYSRKESDLRCYSNEELQDLIDKKGWKSVHLIDTNESNSFDILSSGNEGIKLWKLFIILTLLFLMLEVAILRLLK